jgi:hypothetical protein
MEIAISARGALSYPMVETPSLREE